MTQAPPPERFFLALSAGSSIVALLALGDLVSDMDEGSSLEHILTEGGIAIFATLGVLAIARHVNALRRVAQTASADALLADERAREAELAADEATAKVHDLEDDLRNTRAQAEQWRQEAGSLLRGLGVVIDQQFERWELTPAEREVAMLLLKGLSHKELAEVRGIGDATARQQARAVYRKAGLNGRHELAAFFLEDLLLPTE